MCSGPKSSRNQLSQGLEVETLSGESIQVTNLSPITINQSKVIKADVDASNGVVHVIDSVSLPTAATKTIVDLASATDSLSTLVAADLADTLSDATGSFTVFAPTNEAFAKLDPETLEAWLLPENKNLLVELLLYHVVVGDVITADEIGTGGHIGPQRSEVIKMDPFAIEQIGRRCGRHFGHLIDAVLIPDGFDIPTAKKDSCIVPACRWFPYWNGSESCVFNHYYWTFSYSFHCPSGSYNTYNRHTGSFLDCECYCGASKDICTGKCIGGCH